jgi:serine/threonine protein kinase
VERKSASSIPGTLDFGLAKLARAEATEGSRTTAAQTVAGAILGTVGYMSPEQARGAPADHRSDIFSLGAILYEMISGRRAFRGDSAVETMNAILKEDPPLLSETGRACPQTLERIVRRCLEKDPEERFQSARDVAFALEALSGVEVPAAAPLAPAPARSRRRAIRADGFASTRRGPGKSVVPSPPRA